MGRELTQVPVTGIWECGALALDRPHLATRLQLRLWPVRRIREPEEVARGSGST